MFRLPRVISLLALSLSDIFTTRRVRPQIDNPVVNRVLNPTEYLPQCMSNSQSNKYVGWSSLYAANSTDYPTYHMTKNPPTRRIEQIPGRPCDCTIFEFAAAEDCCAAAERAVGDHAGDEAISVDDGPRGRRDAAGESGRPALRTGAAAAPTIILSALPSMLSACASSTRARRSIHTQVLVDTIAQFNAACRDDVPFDPTRLDGKRTHGLTIPKSNWATRVETLPFRAYPVTCGITFTFGGVRINPKAQVLNTMCEPIRGLYASGDIVGLFFHNYPSFTGQTRNAVFGRLAGAHAAAGS
jgi:hypothetical protein